MATACTVQKIHLSGIPQGSGDKDVTAFLLASVTFSTGLSDGMTANLSTWFSYCRGGFCASKVSDHHADVIVRSGGGAASVLIHLLQTDGTFVGGSDVSAYSGVFAFYGR